MNEEIRPCPFCGGDAHECLDNHFDCFNLGCSMAGARAIPLEDWNTRPIEDALNKRIAELGAERRWIPVTEKLPEDNETVVSYVWLAQIVSVSRYCKREHVFYEYWRGGMQTVTHWMPLPPNPEVEE